LWGKYDLEHILRRVNMDRNDFEKYLKKSGRSASAADRCIQYVAQYEEFLINSRRSIRLEEANPEDLIEFIRIADEESNSRSKSYLWAIRYYYNYTGNSDMSNLAGMMREERIIRKPFVLKDFRDVDIDCIKALAAYGIRTTDQMLEAGATQENRRVLSDQVGVTEQIILEFVKLSDLARIPGVKGTRARLYYEAGIDSVKKIANLEPEDLRNRVVAYVEESDFAGVPTLPAEAVYTVEKARNLPIIIDAETI
jgi:replicative superfamily II helicase